MSKLHFRAALMLVGLLAILFSVSLVIAQEDDTLPQLAPVPTPSIDWSAIELPPHDLPAAEENRGPVPDAPEPTPEPVSSHEEPTAAADTAAATEPPPQATPQPVLPAVPVIIGSDPGSYIVRRGDTLFEIALAYGVNTRALAAFNHLSNPNLIYPGQRLEIPPAGDAPTVLRNATPAAAIPPHRYTVQSSETLEEIARQFGISVQEIAAANTLKTISYISPGTSLIIPERGDAAALQTTPTPVPIATPVPVPTVPVTPVPTLTPQPAAAAITAEPVSDGPTSYTVQSGDTLQTIARRYGLTVEALALFNQLGNWWLIYPGQVLTIPSAHDPIPTRTPYPEGTAYIWPVESRAIIKGYQYGHAAIDIVVESGTPVVAVADGVVEFAGWNNYGYGWLIVVNHSDGVSTLYAHHDSLAVEAGQEVKQGEVIGFSGNTGNSTMPHLHLEFRLNLGVVNPCSYLPDGC